jgi:hypothetical protein
MKYEVNGTEYPFKNGQCEGTEVLTATYTQNGESFTIWSSDMVNLPESEKKLLNTLIILIGQLSNQVCSIERKTL